MSAFKLLMYGGLEREEFEELLPDAWRRNRVDLKTYSMLAFYVFLFLSIANAIRGGLNSVYEACYVAMALFNVIIHLCACHVAPKYPDQAPLFSYAFMIVLYAFAILMNALRPDQPAVTSMVLLFAVPFLTTDRPIRMVALTVLNAIALNAVSMCVKSADIARTDLWNSLTFSAIAIIVEVMQQKARFHSLSQGRKVRYLSETDLLTGAKNRNRYEDRQPYYAEHCRERLTCVYIDANGLHELNDTNGHRAGDAMLRIVGAGLIARFGEEHTYRIGGDEFVCFRMDVPEADTRRDMAEIAAALRAQGYNISVGIATGEKRDLDIAALIITAENAMYQEKEAYYRTSGKDRRRR